MMPSSARRKCFSIVLCAESPMYSSAMERIRAARSTSLPLGLLAGVELELALVPDRQGIDRLFADHLADGSVHHLPVLQIDKAAVRVARESELACFPGDADELDDVGQRQFFERSLKGHF